MSEKEGRRKERRESEVFSISFPVILKFVSHFEVSPQAIVSYASLSAVLGNNDMTDLTEALCTPLLVW